MKMFILEDNSERRGLFRKKFGFGNELVFAESAKEGINILSKDLNTFDVLTLDHDLGGKVFVSSGEENTGYTVAKWLKDKDFSGQIIIHSWNPEGAKNMKSLLPQAIRDPQVFL